MNTEKVFIKEENADSDMCYRPIEVVQTDGPNLENSSNPVEMTYEDVGLGAEENTVSCML